VFLVGILPALLVLWIRRAVPEPAEWHLARQQLLVEQIGNLSHQQDLVGRIGNPSHSAEPGFLELFRGSVCRITVLTILVCALSLTAHWAFIFWSLQHVRNLPDLNGWTEPEKTQLVSKVFWLVMLASVAGNFLAAWLARWLSYRRAITCLCLAYSLSMFVTYCVPREHGSLWYGFAAIGLCQGVFALFTMYLPPLFPTLLRTTGAGFCYNIGRIAAGLGTVFFGLFSKVGDYRLALFYAGFLFLPAAAVAIMLPETPDEKSIRTADHGKDESC
jgi:MFS family permease